MYVRLDVPLPDELEVGAGTALFVAGWCYSPGARIEGLELVVDGTTQPLSAHGMPRLEVLEAVADPSSYRSGFWGLARIEAPPANGMCELAVEARLTGGRQERAHLGRIPIVARESPAPIEAPDPTAGPFVAVCMATYDPPPDLLQRQIESIRGQAHRNWVCVISDDCSTPERFAEIERAVAGDPRFVVSRSPRQRGFYGNFERALALAPRAADYVAMADQDDAWYPDKLATLLERIGLAQLVYSDARVVSRTGEVLADTFWELRRNDHDDLLSLLVANAVTGAASLFRRDLLDTALPFPPAQFTHFHDHWIALTARALGDVAFVERPLYDYVQHHDASLGHAATNRITRLRDRVDRLRRDPRDRVRLWRMHYFIDVWRLMQFATVLRMRGRERIDPAKRATLDRFLATDRSLTALARLWGRGARDIVVRRPKTLGAEWTLSYAFTWRRALSATARLGPGTRLRMDAMPPPSLRPKPGRQGPGGAASEVAEKVAPLDLAMRDDAPPRVNVLIPTVDLDHLFGGYIAKLNLARRLAESGLRVRIVTVDRVRPLPPSWRAQVESYAGLDGLFDRVEVAFGREAGPLEVSRADHFVATTWPSAHVAARAARALGGERFLYLIQEYEPFTFAMGTYAAMARDSYALPHAALFSTELLREYFRRHEIGVYARGAAAGDEASAAFENAITAVPAPSASELAARRTRRLLFHARPEPHAARNMFELGVLAIDRALELGALAGWELRGIGGLGGERRLSLGGGAALELLPRADQRSYARVLGEHDVGLALMYTPHPSLVPLEMASAGMVTVTNTFENKTAEALAALSPNLLAVEPTVDALAAGLGRAAAAADDYERRAEGSHVRWSRDWNASFDDELLRRVMALLET
jgi:glycosyltransferase involved in cell wall biosynthesis